jgi:WD40 repeat protein
MAPEQLEGGGDGGSDVYSLGVVLYRLLTGKLPFEAKTARELMDKVRTEHLRGPRSLRPDVPRDLELICLKAMARLPQQRFQRAKALEDELWRWLEGEPLTVRPPTLWEKARGWYRRHQVRAWAAAVLTGAVVVAGLAAAVAFHRGQVQAAETHAEAIAQTQVEAAEARARKAAAEAREAKARGREAAAKARAYYEVQTRRELEVRARLEQARSRLAMPTEGRRREAQAILRLAGKGLALIAPRQKREGLLQELRSVYAATLAVPDLAPVAEHETVALPFSPNACWPAALHPDGKAMVLGLPGGPVYWPRGKAPKLPARIVPTFPLPRLAYSPDGNHLVFAPPDGSVQLWDREVTRHRELEKTGRTVVRAIGFGKGSKSLLVIRSDGRLRTWSLPEGKEVLDRKLPVKDLGTITAAAFNETATDLAVADDTGRVVLVELVRNRVRELVQFHERVGALAWSPGSELIAVGTRFGLVGLWHANGTPAHSLGPLSLAPEGLWFSPDGRWLLAGHRSGPMRIWDTITGEQVLSGSDAPLGFSRDGRTLAQGNQVAVSFRSVVYPETLQRLTGHRSQVWRVAWSEDGRYFATQDNRFEVRVWDRQGARLLRIIAVPDGSFFASNAGIALSGDGRYLAYASGGKLESHALIYDVKAGKVVKCWTIRPGGFDYLTSTKGGKFLLVPEQFTPGKGTVDTVLWQLEVGAAPRQAGVLRKSRPGDQELYLMAFLTQQGFYCWVGPRKGLKRRVELWDVKTGKHVTTIHPWGSGIGPEYLAVPSPDGRRLWVQQENGWLLHDLSRSDPRCAAPALRWRSP